mgnify:CR=1 FL=1
MKFKKLEIAGFKSFFDKTVFLIEDGLTGIVGPNGCGKSNIVESLRWCMGETSAKSMRGAGMEDVIFSGTTNKPEKNLCEVNIEIDNSANEGQAPYKDIEKIIVTRKIERDKGSKYFINNKEVRARDAQTFFADLSTGAHSPSLISQGRIGQLVIAKPVERRSILEEAAGISGIHARRKEAELRLNAAENNLKRADELKKQQEKQLINLKKQAEEASKYKEISSEVKKIEASIYYLKVKNIEDQSKIVKNNLNDQEDEISALQIDLNHNLSLLDDEGKRLTPLRDKKVENLASLQKINLDIENLENESNRFKNIKSKLEKSLKTIEADIEREKSINLDANLNEKRILEEKNELLKTDKELSYTQSEASDKLINSKSLLENLLHELNNQLDYFEKLIDTEKKIAKALFLRFKELINKITSSQENYASAYGINESIKNDSIKRRERIKNIDVELENWRNLKNNSEKMLLELDDRKSKVELELEDNKQSPEKIASLKGQSKQNLENLQKRREEIETELLNSEDKYNKIDSNIKEVQEKLTVLRENKARNEATLEGYSQRKKDLFFSIKNELNIEDESQVLSLSGLSEIEPSQYPSIEEMETKLIEIRKKREAMGSVNLRADVETKKYEDEIKKMEDDRSDLYSAIVKLKKSLEELDERGRQKILDAFEKINRKFNEVYTKLFNGGNAKLELVDSEDPLEAGLELLVSPPGKRLQSITLLSGGEQALTALALVFAVFLVNPSPICVLDEVDAPLDDSNVTRFCALLDEFTKITQTKFIIITHHALTMSRMHRLYGVTMPEKGISQLVAVDLQKAEELVA